MAEESNKEISDRINEKRKEYESEVQNEFDKKHQLLQKIQDTFKDLDYGIYSIYLNDWKEFRVSKYDDSDIIDKYTDITIYVIESGFVFKKKKIKMNISIHGDDYMFGINEAHKLNLENIKMLYKNRVKLLYKIESKYTISKKV